MKYSCAAFGFLMGPLLFFIFAMVFLILLTLIYKLVCFSDTQGNLDDFFLFMAHFIDLFRFIFDALCC